MQDVLFTVSDNGVAGIVAALGAHNDVGLLGDVVDNFALSFVAPLGAGDDDVRHGFRSFVNGYLRGNGNRSVLFQFSVR